jgi:hypothetical protein
MQQLHVFDEFLTYQGQVESGGEDIAVEFLAADTLTLNELGAESKFQVRQFNLQVLKTYWLPLPRLSRAA